MNTKPCPICRENHDPARGLSLDAMRRALAELLAEIQHVDGEPGMELSSLSRAEFDAMIVRADEALAAAGGDPGRE